MEVMLNCTLPLSVLWILRDQRQVRRLCFVGKRVHRLLPPTWLNAHCGQVCVCLGMCITVHVNGHVNVVPVGTAASPGTLGT